MLRAPGQGRGVAVPWVWEGGPDVGSEGGPEPGFLRVRVFRECSQQAGLSHSGSIVCEPGFHPAVADARATVVRLALGEQAGSWRELHRQTRHVLVKVLPQRTSSPQGVSLRAVLKPVVRRHCTVGGNLVILSVSVILNFKQLG